jgi:hypothetical protein
LHFEMLGRVEVSLDEDLLRTEVRARLAAGGVERSLDVPGDVGDLEAQIGRASCRERV